MNKIVLGKVMMIAKGDYSDAEQYEKLDFVMYNGCSYVAKQSTRGNIPTNENYWQLLSGKGDTGPQGIQGEKGDKGDKGDTGTQGIQGIQGEKGDKGDKGDAFTYSDFTEEQLASLKGEKGDKGDKGDTGPQGIQGIQGEKGNKGDTGTQGPQGEQGIQGIQGEKGDKGDKGDTGPQGIQGIQGEKGETGANGKDGVSPSVDISKSGKVTTINITDATGVHTATINDGEKGEKGDNGAIMISSGDDDTTTIEKLLSAIENNKIVKPAFYKNPNNEILTLTRFVIGFNKTKIFDFYKITNSEVNFIEFTISSDNILTKNENSIYWSEIIGENNSLKMENFVFEGDGTTKVFTYTLSTMPGPGKLPIVNLYKPNSDGGASIIQENIDFNFNNKTITITLNEPLEKGGLIGGSVLYDTSSQAPPM